MTTNTARHGAFGVGERFVNAKPPDSAAVSHHLMTQPILAYLFVLSNTTTMAKTQQLLRMPSEPKLSQTITVGCRSQTHVIILCLHCGEMDLPLNTVSSGAESGVSM